MQTSSEKAYRFWLPLGVDIMKLVVEVGVIILVAYYGARLSQQEALPRLKQIGRISQLPADDGYLTVRLKNFSTREDAAIVGVRFEVTDRRLLGLLNKRVPFVKNSPPPPAPYEHIATDPERIDLTYWDWAYDGESAYFTEVVEAIVEPGKTQRLRIRISDGDSGLLDGAWFTGTLIVEYDNDRVVIENASLFEKDTAGVTAIPAQW